MTAAELALPSPVAGLAALDADLAALNPELRASLAGKVRDGIPENTRNTYTRLYKRFDKWCALNGLEQQIMPVTAASLGGYLTVLSDDGVQPSTLRHVVSVLISRQKAEGHGGLPGPVETMVDKLIRGHVQQGRYERTQKAHPLVPEAIREVAQNLDYQTLAGLRAGLILSLGYSAATRESELCAFTIGDVTFRSGGLNVYFRKSKGDQLGVGADRLVPQGHYVRTDPVTRLREYLDALASYGVDITDASLPLLRSLTKNGKPRPITTKLDAKGVLRAYGGLSVRKFDGILRAACRQGGLPQWEMVSGHSMRAGYATACAFSQDPYIPLSAWAEHGRWSVTSRVPMLYVRDADLVLNNPLQFVGV